MIRRIIWIANTKATKRRAVSQVIGSLAMMAIVSAVGSVVMFQGLNGIQGFNNILTGFITSKRDSAGENLMIEHAQFQISGGSCSSSQNCVTITIRNIGTIDATIKTIKIMRMDSQTIILNQNINLPVYVKNIASQQFTSLGTLDLTQIYRIAITTEKGNSYSSMATSYNT